VRPAFAACEINQGGNVVTEARLERVSSGLTPVTPGWFVVNVADVAWVTNECYGGVCIFESDGVVLQGRPDLTRYEKPDAGFTIRVVPPGQVGMLNHAESTQEDFLVLQGECVMIIEDQERRLRAWDFVHCPPMTAHAYVATDAGPCVILATGNRREDAEVVHPRSEVALRYDASTEVDMTEPEPRGRWEVRRPAEWDELPWAERP
jgi:uncharacterized cupin superfamily protein